MSGWQGWQHWQDIRQQWQHLYRYIAATVALGFLLTNLPPLTQYCITFNTMQHNHTPYSTQFITNITTHNIASHTTQVNLATHHIFNAIQHIQHIHLSICNNIPYNTTKYLKNSAQNTTSWPGKLKVLDLPVTFPGLPFFPFPFLKLHNTGIKKSSLPVYVMKTAVYVRESTFMLLSQSTNCKYFGVVVF